MITLTKLNDTQFVINEDYIETMEETPDTTITMTTGRKIIVRESIDDIMEAIIEFNRTVKSPAS